METALPVRLEDLKGHLRIANSDFDDILQVHLAAAIESAENYTGITLRDSTWKCSGVAETDTICTDILPVREVVSVEVDGRPVEVGDVESDGSHLRIPGARGKRVSVTFRAGYEQAPYDIVAAVLLIAARFFEHPTDSVEQLPKASTNLLTVHKRWGR